MPNPLFKQLGGDRAAGPFGGMQQMMDEFAQFKASFQGDPRQQVQQLLNSGKMTQEQYNEIARAAQGMAQMMGM